MSNPSWTRAAGLSTYGGHVNKRDYMSQGAIDGLTDVSAAQFNRTASDLSAVVPTAPFCVITYTQDDTGTSDPTVDGCLLQPSGQTGSYAGASPPTGFPTATRNGNGDVTITFAASYTDALSVSGVPSIAYATGTVHGSTAATAVVETTASTVRVRVFDAAGSADTDRKVSVVIY